MSVRETMMPPGRRATVNGVELAYHEVGARRGLPVVFCHGFPEIAFSWRHQLKAFEAAGRWAIALDQRGYGLSSRPEAVTDYDMAHLTGDLVGLLDHLGVERAIFCGHDWGGFVVWQMPLVHPQRTAGVIGLNTPFQARAQADPVALMRMRFGEDMYIVWFQKMGEADALLAENVERTMRFFMRKPRELEADLQTREGRSTFAFGEMVRRYEPATDAGQFLSVEEFAVFIETFKRTGFTGAINWYRNMTRNWERSEGLPTRIDNLPCLMITAELDAVLTPSMAAGMPNLIGDLEMHEVKGSGHWTQQEKPDEVNRMILDWLNRRFPT